MTLDLPLQVSNVSQIKQRFVPFTSVLDNREGTDGEVLLHIVGVAELEAVTDVVHRGARRDVRCARVRIDEVLQPLKHGAAAEFRLNLRFASYGARISSLAVVS